MRRDRTLQELEQWLSQLPASWGKSLMTCTPADIVTFLESHWLSAHATPRLADDSLIPSPRGLNRCLSNLSTGFQLIGRVISCTTEAGGWLGVWLLGIDISPVKKKKKKKKSLALRVSGVFSCPHQPTKGASDYLNSLLAQDNSPMIQLVLEQDVLLALLMRHLCEVTIVAS